MTGQFVIGLAGAPFGLDGFVKVKTFSGETGHFKGLKEVVLRQKESERRYSVEEVRFAGNAEGFLYLKFAGIDSPEGAKTLGGAELIADRTHAAALKEGEYYVEDLKGLEVIAEDNEVLGRIAGFIEGGGGDIAEIRLISGETRLVPFRNEFFGEIDLIAGRAILLKRWILE